MSQADNDKINSAVEAATMKVKLDQLDRTVGHVVATHRLGFGVVAFFFTVVAVLLAVIIPLVNVMWNTLSSVDQSTAELKSEVAALRASLGETPDQLVRFLEDLEEAKRDLDRQVRQIQSSQELLFRAATTVESRTALWNDYMSDIKSDIEALKRGLLPPEKQTPDRMIQIPDMTR